jgi:hypothetical protein
MLPLSPQEKHEWHGHERQNQHQLEVIANGAGLTCDLFYRVVGR